jgi:soluble lytic murein transglycosylase-like protein
MQVMPATARELGVRSRDLFDPEANIAVGAQYLALLFKEARRRDRGGASEPARTLRRVIAAYHSGPSVMNAPSWSEPTRSYVRTVMGCYASAASAMGTEQVAVRGGTWREGL